MKLTEKTAVGTSFHGTTVHTTAATLIAILGEPQYDDNGAGDKVNLEWECEDKNGEVFTIYDWKEYRMIGLEEQICWHIGGMDSYTTEGAKEEIEAAIAALTATVPPTDNNSKTTEPYLPKTTEEFTEYLETFFEIGAYLKEQAEQHNEGVLPDALLEKQGIQDRGTGAFWSLTEKLTTEFQTKYAGTIWGEELEWSDTLETFLFKLDF